MPRRCSACLEIEGSSSRATDPGWRRCDGEFPVVVTDLKMQRERMGDQTLHVPARNACHLMTGHHDRGAIGPSMAPTIASQPPDRQFLALIDKPYQQPPDVRPVDLGKRAAEDAIIGLAAVACKTSTRGSGAWRRAVTVLIRGETGTGKSW